MFKVGKAVVFVFISLKTLFFVIASYSTKFTMKFLFKVEQSQQQQVVIFVQEVMMINNNNRNKEHMKLRNLLCTTLYGTFKHIRR